MSSPRRYRLCMSGAEHPTRPSSVSGGRGFQRAMRATSSRAHDFLLARAWNTVVAALRLYCPARGGLRASPWGTRGCPQHRRSTTPAFSYPPGAPSLAQPSRPLWPSARSTGGRCCRHHFPVHSRYNRTTLFTLLATSLGSPLHRLQAT